MVTVTPAEPPDVPAISGLMKELDHFYGAAEEADPPGQRISDISSALFGPAPAAYLLLARDDGELVGMASYSFLWPAAGLTRSLFLKELYVKEERKREGIGKALMHEVFRVALERGCSRVEWQTEMTNGDAQLFYAALGAPVFDGKVFYRLTEEDAAKIVADGPRAGAQADRAPSTDR